MKLKLAILVSSILLLVALMSVTSRSAHNADASTEGEQSAGTAAPQAVLVELFTSEGCSSCPPADKLLSELDQAQPIKGVQVIALSEHVDYWDRLGWKDPFSSEEFTRRQGDYGRALAVEDIYTPQMVVDGRTHFTGSRRETAFDAIAKAAGSPKGDVGITIKAAAKGSVTFTVQVENIPDVARGDTADVMLALTESGLLSKVSRGENSGRDLAHSAVTRKLIKIGSANDKAFSAERSLRLDSTWKRQNMKVVAFVQERNSRRVLGATAIKLSPDA